MATPGDHRQTARPMGGQGITMYTLKDAARLVSLHPRTLRRWIKAGRIEADKVPGKHGETWLFDRAQLDALRDITARDVVPVVCDIEEPAPNESAGELTAPGFDVGALLGQLGELLDGQRAAAIDAERRAAGGELDGLRAQVAALQGQVAAERRRADAAQLEASALRSIVVELREALSYARDLRRWGEIQSGALPAPGRTTLPFNAAMLRAVRDAS